MLSCWAADTGAGALARCLEQTEKRGKHRQIAMHVAAVALSAALRTFNYIAICCATYSQLHSCLLLYMICYWPKCAVLARSVLLLDNEQHGLAIIDPVFVIP